MGLLFLSPIVGATMIINQTGDELHCAIAKVVLNGDAGLDFTDVIDIPQANAGEVGFPLNLQGQQLVCKKGESCQYHMFCKSKKENVKNTHVLTFYDSRACHIAIRSEGKYIRYSNACYHAQNDD